MNVQDAHFRVIDHGIFLPIARRLAEQAGHVSYWTPWEKPFPTLRDVIGDGFTEIERVESPWQDAHSVNVFVFPDIGFSDLQRQLVTRGYAVWGARNADELEAYRGKFIKSLAKTDLPVPPHETIVGMTALREHLRDRKDCWVKISKWRGDWETLHWRDQAQDDVELDERATKLGPFKDAITFYVFDKIDTKIEDGCDSWCIDSQMPKTVIHGMEAKDKAYLGTFQRFSDLPEEIRIVSEQYAPILGGYGCRGFFSTEVRITEDGKSYFIDPTIRSGSPPAQVMCEMIGNYAEIILAGAAGEIVEPERRHRFGVQAMLNLCGGRRHWRSLEVPDDLDRWVKCGFCNRVGGRLAFPPDPDAHAGECGWLVGVGDTAADAINHLKQNAAKLPDGVHCDFHMLADLLREVDEAEREGMEFTDQTLPKPEIVIAEKGG